MAQIVKCMFRVSGAEPNSIFLQCRNIYVVHSVILQQHPICTIGKSISNHHPNDLFGTMIVAIVVTLIGSTHKIIVDINGTDSVVCPRHIYYNYIFSIRINNLDILVFQQINIYLVLAIDSIPEILANLVGIIHSYYFKPLSDIFLLAIFDYSQ